MKMQYAKERDITCDIGDIYQHSADPTIRMYSFSRPSRMLWQSVYDGLRAGGCTDEQAVEWLKSKAPRWLLDDSLGTALIELGHKIGAEHAVKEQRK